MANKNDSANIAKIGLHYTATNLAYRYDPINSWKNGRTLALHSGIHYQNRFTRSRSWVTTPDYRSRVASATPLPENPFSYTEQFKVYTNGQWGRRSGGNYSITVWDEGILTESVTATIGEANSVGAKTQPTASEKTALANAVATKIRLKVQDQKVNLLQAVGERKQTARLFADTVNRLAKAIKGLKTGDYRGFAEALGVTPRKRARSRYNKAWYLYQDAQRKARTAQQRREAITRYQKAVAQGWLEGVYGWQPLISDLYGAVDAVRRKSHDQIYRRAVAMGELRKKMRSKGVWPSTGVPYLEWNAEDEYKYTQKYTVYFTVTEPALHETGQLGLVNPFATAWELVPWSFVVDWLLPVGNWIQSWGATVGLTFSHGSQSTSLRYTSRRWAESSRNADRKDVQSNWNYWQGSMSGFDMTRGSLSSWPVVSFPDFKNPFSELHIANALALLRTNFGGWR